MRLSELFPNMTTATTFVISGVKGRSIRKVILSGGTASSAEALRLC